MEVFWKSIKIIEAQVDPVFHPYLFEGYPPQRPKKPVIPNSICCACSRLECSFRSNKPNVSDFILQQLASLVENLQDRPSCHQADNKAFDLNRTYMIRKMRISKMREKF
jgi:hypothetical protein